MALLRDESQALLLPASVASQSWGDGGCHPGLEEFEGWRKTCGMQ